MAGTEVAVTNGGGLLAQYKAGVNPFLADAGNDEFFGSFLKFNGNNGDFAYGDDYAEEIPHGTELLLNMETALHGWICWVDGEVKDEQNVLIASGKQIADEDDLEDYGPYEKHADGTQDGWQEQYVFHFFWEDEEEAFTLKLSSKSGLRAAKNLVRQYGKTYGVKIGKDGDIQVPVIEIGSTSFDVKDENGKINKKAGKKHAPTFKITDWADKADVADCFDTTPGDDADDYDEPEEKATEPETRRGGRGKANDKPAETSSRGGNRRQREPEPVVEDGGDDPDQGGDDVPEEKTETRGGGRRTRVVHAEPQDEEPAPEERQQSARGRRGRNRG